MAAPRRRRDNLDRLASVILAAGKGTRMNSERGKVLHEVLGVPMVSYPVLRAQELGAAPIVAVLGHQRADVEAVLVARHGAGAVTVVEQTEQRGTGHAVRLGLAPLEGWDGLVLILYGDVPLLRRETLAPLVAEAQRTGGLTFLSMRVPDPAGYGRVVRDGRRRVRRIVEDKDATAAQRRIAEVNGGIYAAPAGFLRDAVAALRPQNAQGEYYLTDVVERAARSIGATTVDAPVDELQGVNDRRQLAAAERALSARAVARWVAHATFHDPEGVRVDADVVIEADADIGRGVALRGRTRIGRGARVGDGAILVDTVVGERADVGAYCVAEGVVIDPGARLPPFSRPPGANRI
jgi:bifunctional UDP-N-acetylglucosamine pyrophosphorylase/glucosamine-1-phosphate N-acetyltransferase